MEAFVGDINMHADIDERTYGKECRHQVGSAITQEGQGESLGGQTVGHHSNIECRLEDEQEYHAKGQKTAEAIWRTDGNQYATRQKDNKGNHNKDREDKAELFPADREDKIRVGLRKIKIFLNALIEANTPRSTAIKGDH